MSGERVLKTLTLEIEEQDGKINSSIKVDGFTNVEVIGMLFMEIQTIQKRVLDKIEPK